MIKKSKRYLFAITSLLVVLSVCTPVFAAEGWKEIYTKYVKADGNDFVLYDIDKDGIPELMYSHSFIIQVNSIRDGKVVRVYTNNNFKDRNLIVYFYAQPSLCFYAPKDASEQALYYTVSTQAVRWDPLPIISLRTELHKITVKNGVFDSVLVSEMDMEFLDPIESPYIKETFFVKDQPVSEYDFISSSASGTRLNTIRPNESIYGWGPARGAITNYTFNTLFRQFEAELPINSRTNISNPTLTIGSYHFNSSLNKGSIENSVMVWYPNVLYDIHVYDDKNPKSPLELLQINGDFVPSGNVIINDNIPYVPLRLTCERLGFSVDWLDGKAAVSDNGAVLDKVSVSPENINMLVDGRIYVPMSYFEKFNCEVQYIKNLFVAGVDSETEVRAVVIERKYDGKFAFTPDQAKDELWVALQESNEYVKTIGSDGLINGYPIEQQLSENQINQLLELKKGFSYEEIKYSGNMGRYYIYTLKDGSYKCCMNKYTGEIYNFHAQGISNGLSPYLY